MKEIKLEAPLLNRGPYKQLWGREAHRALSLASLGHSVFSLEQNLRNERSPRALLPLLGSLAQPDGGIHVLKEVRSLLRLILLEDIELSFYEMPKVTDIAQEEVSEAEAACLFSGGVDSLCGILRAREEFINVEAVFCAHTDQSKIQGIVKRLKETLLEEIRVPLVKLEVPPIGTGGFAQMRGFLYLVTGAAWMDFIGGDTLVVSEVGPTMYQPRLAPFDEVTMTTHPYVVDSARSVTARVLEKRTRFLTPFEDWTKAEVMAWCPEPDLLPLTHSCISQRFGHHDGTCYGCVIRNLSALAADVPDVSYKADPVTSEKANKDNLLALLDFATVLLVDYENLEYFRSENIELFGKRDLFRRFALDVFCGLHRHKQVGGRLSTAVKRIYNLVLESVGKEELKARIDQLESLKTSSKVNSR